MASTRGDASSSPQREVLLEIKNLRTHFHTDRGVVRAVDGVDLTIHRNETIGIVGESGCGKSVMALSVMGLIARPPARLTGEIVYHRRDGTILDLAKLNPNGPEIRSVRGAEIAMIFQEPMTSLNPVHTVGRQIAEVIMLHQQVTKKEARDRAIAMLQKVGIPTPERRVDDYPHQMSGGMRQRVMIAMALSCNPDLLIADEPTTALDVTIQAQILELMQQLQEEFKTAIVLITHDLGVVAGMADEVAVMYLGQIVEHGSAADVFEKRLHPYTEGLLRSIPSMTMNRTNRLTPIEGTVPDARHMPKGCRFHDRCSKRMRVCVDMPDLLEDAPKHFSRCWLHRAEVNHDG